MQQEPLTDASVRTGDKRRKSSEFGAKFFNISLFLIVLLKGKETYKYNIYLNNYQKLVLLVLFILLFSLLSINYSRKVLCLLFPQQQHLEEIKFTVRVGGEVTLPCENGKDVHERCHNNTWLLIH